MTEYRFEYSIKRQRDDEDDFVEIGFGAATWGDIDGAVHAAASDIQSGHWETSDDMPDPNEVMAEIRGET